MKSNLVSKIVGNVRYLSEEQIVNVNRLIHGESPDSVISPNSPSSASSQMEDMVASVVEKVLDRMKGNI